jgi:hypothetical protein
MRFPETPPQLTTRRVLIMEMVVGSSVADALALDTAAKPRADMADQLLTTFLVQTLQDGLFHADPRPGNVLVDAAGDLWLIDYGAVVIIDPITLESLQLLAGGFLQRDAGMMARAMPSIRSMPQLVEDLALQTRAWRLTVRSERFATGDRYLVDNWIDRSLFVAIGIIGLFSSAVLRGAAVLAESTQVAPYLYGAGFAGLFLTTTMLLRALAQIQRR